MKRPQQRLLRIRRTIGAIGPHRPRLKPAAAEMLSNALTFAEAASARYAVRRAGEPTTMVFGRAAMELKLFLARPAAAKVTREDPGQRQRPGVSLAMPPDSLGHVPAAAHRPDAVGTRPQLTSSPAAMTATDHHSELLAQANAATSLTVESPMTPGTLVSPSRPGEPHSPRPPRPQTPPFAPVPRRLRRIEQEIAMQVTKEIRHLQQITDPLAPAAHSAAPTPRSIGPNEGKPVSILHLTDDVVRELERRATARRERKGHI